jgi:hypothetical protein
LLGTIIGTDEQIGVFLETAKQNVVRLRVGEEHQGWVLRQIKGREATLVKGGEQAVVVELLPPGEAASGSSPPGSLPGIPMLNRTNSADEQPAGWKAPRAKGR